MIYLAYKRYIHKKGKKHGPYYYKNIRGKNGKVKSIYLGKKRSIHHLLREKGRGPLKLTIAILFILLILISMLFFIQNRNLVLSRKASEKSFVPFDVDQILIKVLVKKGELLGKEIRVMNTWDKEATIKVEAVGISGIAKVVDSGFTIKPGQTKIVEINFSSFDREKSIEHVPGVYVGKIVIKSENFEKDIPVIVEIETKEVLFDSNLNPASGDKKVLQGGQTTIEVRLFNLQSIEATNVDMDYFVKDLNGNTIISEKENVVVETRASFFKVIKIPQNLKTGSYVFIVQASYGNSVGTASYLFEVASEEKQIIGFIPLNFMQFCRTDPLCWALSLIILILIFTVGAYLYFFLGAYLYNKFFGIKSFFKKKPEGVSLVVVEKKQRKESKVKVFFRNWREKKRQEMLKLKAEKERLMEEERKRQEKAKIKEQEKKKIEEDRKRKQKEQERLKVKTEKEKTRKQREEEKKKIILERENIKLGRYEKNILNKCNKLVKKCYKSLEKGKLTKAKLLYNKLMEFYFYLTDIQKRQINDKIDDLYEELKKKEETPIKEKEKKIEEKELEIAGGEKKRALFGFLKEKELAEKKIKAKPQSKVILEIPRVKKKKGSRLFVKCCELMNESNKAFNIGNKNEAIRLYVKSRKIYIKLEYEEKKKVYKQLINTYNKLNE